MNTNSKFRNNLKNIFVATLFFYISFQAYGEDPVPHLYPNKISYDIYSELTESPYFSERIASFLYSPGIKVHINAPAESEFNKSKPTKIIIYALPNGNTTDWTIGKLPAVGDDWHFHIQHIGAQTRYIRTVDKDYNYVTVYVEADNKSWGNWRRTETGRDLKIKEFVEYIHGLFSSYNPQIELNSHSGGGNFIFGFLEENEKIPAYIKKISFIDSNYNWDEKKHGTKLLEWLKLSQENRLFIACYDDANALYEGKPFVSRKGGTWHKTSRMRKFLNKNIKAAGWHKIENDSIKNFITDNRQIQIFFRKNPERKIYHTVLVERNGFIHSVFSGTDFENFGYSYMGEKAYDKYRQDSVILPHIFNFPPRKSTAVTGSEFVNKVLNMNASERDSVVYKEISEGNVPQFLKQAFYLTDSLKDAEGKFHKITLCVLPDYLSIGTNEDFIRIPMLPGTAQKIADLYGASLPTAKISDLIHSHSGIKMDPFPMTPDSTMTTVPVFARHSALIESERISLLRTSNNLISGHKKDIVITNRLAKEGGRLFIYGWHYKNGKAIQPLSGAHNSGYVDYSHGTRLIRDEVLVDNKIYSLKALLQDPILYTLFSDEDGPMEEVQYP